MSHFILNQYCKFGCGCLHYTMLIMILCSLISEYGESGKSIILDSSAPPSQYIYWCLFCGRACAKHSAAFNINFGDSTQTPPPKTSPSQSVWCPFYQPCGWCCL